MWMNIREIYRDKSFLGLGKPLREYNGAILGSFFKYLDGFHFIQSILMFLVIKTPLILQISFQHPSFTFLFKSQDLSLLHPIPVTSYFMEPKPIEQILIFSQWFWGGHRKHQNIFGPYLILYLCGFKC